VETEQRRGLERFSDDARAWCTAVGARVPPYARLLEAAAGITDAPDGLAERAARGRLDAAWRERRFAAAYDRPLLLMAALRAEAFRAGAAHPLHAAVASEPPDPEAATREALATALGNAPARLYVDLATRWVQTNETSRAVAWLWPAALAGCGGREGTAGARPLVLADVGCSAGLNLVAGALPPLWADPSGQPLPVAAGARLAGRHGFDARPLDVRRADDAGWLRACVWPGEAARCERLDRAIAEMRAALAGGDAPEIEPADLADVPERLEAIARAAAPGTLVLAYQTVVRDYLLADARAAHAERMRAWVAGGAPGARVFVELEAAPDAWTDATGVSPTPMALTAQVRAGGERDRGDDGVRVLTLGRCSYHPTLVVPDATAVAAFSEVFHSRSVASL
jgi:hypothetical protein